MSYRDDFIVAERAAAEKRANEAIEAISYCYENYQEERSLICLLLSTPDNVIQNALGYCLKVEIPARTKDSDSFEHWMFDGFVGTYSLIAKLEWIGHWVSYNIMKHRDPGVAFYKMIYVNDIGFDVKIVFCDKSDSGAIPFIVASREMLERTNGIIADYTTEAIEYAVRFHAEQEHNQARISIQFDCDDDSGITYDGETHESIIKWRLETPDVIFGRQLVADLKTKYGE